MIAQLDLAFDMTFNGQVFAAIQFALDDDGFSNVHDISRTGCPVIIRPSGWGRSCRGGYSRRRWRG
jgi:hypothetical protein